jgi:hypothetical protein
VFRLLSLFGELPTTQFMSQALGWADNIILSMAPLGIITIIIAAIRVGGPSWFRSIIGRAREARADVEAELMSSTSAEVCELWDGQQVARVVADGPVCEFIILVPEGIVKNTQRTNRLVSRIESDSGPTRWLRQRAIRGRVGGRIYRDSVTSSVVTTESDSVTSSVARIDRDSVAGSVARPESDSVGGQKIQVRLKDAEKGEYPGILEKHGQAAQPLFIPPAYLLFRAQNS